MTVRDCTSLKDWAKQITRDMKAREKRVKRGQTKTADQTARWMKANTIPKAFGDLMDSVHVETTSDGAILVTDAPHAAAVENGSRPHWVPLEALIKWVKLRGMQGIMPEKKLQRLPGSTTQMHARSIAQQIRDHSFSSRTTPIDAPEKIARAIQAAIAKRGTKPQHYQLKSMPALNAFLHQNMQDAVEERD